MAWVSSARAPLRRISVRESLKAPGWVSLITLLSDTAYHSFIGEVEALNTTTIRRLTRSRRHQLLAIALADGPITSVSAPPAKRIARSTTTRLCGCAGGSGTSTKSGDARAGAIHSRTFTGTSSSYASHGLVGARRG